MSLLVIILVMLVSFIIVGFVNEKHYESQNHAISNNEIKETMLEILIPFTKVFRLFRRIENE